MNRRAAALLTGLSFLLLPGCYADVESFAVASAKQECKRLKKCNLTAFIERHDEDMGQCRSDLEERNLNTADTLELGGWEYDQDAGQECVSVQRELRSDCSNDATEDINRACDDLFWDGF